MTLHDNQLVIGTKLYTENPNISSRELARKLPNNDGGYGVRLQTAQEILRTIKNVEKNPEMVINPFGQKGKKSLKPIIITNQNGELVITRKRSEKPKKEKRIRNYRYYIEVEATENFYPYFNPSKHFIRYGINSQSDIDAIESELALKYHDMIVSDQLKYQIVDQDWNPINRYDVE